MEVEVEVEGTMCGKKRLMVGEAGWSLPFSTSVWKLAVVETTAKGNHAKP